MTDELAVLETSGLAVSRAPEQVLDEAHEAAKALKRVIEAKPNKVLFGGEQYLEFEDWQTVGRFYGIAPRIVVTRYVEYGGAAGWEATAEAVHVPTQRVVSTADAMCLNDEEKWRDRPKYAWVYHKRSGGTSVEDPGKDELIWERGGDGKNRPKKSKELIGTEAVPQFQLRSMAQTRAGAKALRNALAWVVVLAGYRPTPAEELPTERVAQEGAVREPVIVPEAYDRDAERSKLAEADAEAARLFPDPPSGDEATESLRSILLSKITSLRERKAMPDEKFAELCRKHNLSVPTLGRADTAALTDLLNTCAQWGRERR